MEEDTQDDEDDGIRVTGGQYQAHWSGNCRRFTTDWNINCGFDGSIYVLERGEDTK